MGGTDLPAAIVPLKGRFSDGSLRSVLLQFNAVVTTVPTLGWVRLGVSGSAPQTISAVAPQGVSTVVIDPLSADYLISTDLFGKTVTIAAAAYPEYESKFVQFADLHWASYGASWEQSNYYDRALNHFVYWARGGDDRFRDRAELLARDYRINYLEHFDYLPAPHNMAMEGVALHYWLTGEEASRTAVIQSVNRITGAYTPVALAQPDYDGRVLHRMLTGAILAMELGDSTRDWRALAQSYVSVALAHQLADGSYAYSGGWNGGQANFMVGLMNDALMKYYERVQPLPEIVESLKRSADYMWSTQWLSNDLGFKYSSKPLAGDYGIQWDAPAQDLNMLIINTFAFVAKMRLDASYRVKADSIADGAMRYSWLNGTKQFNQTFYSSHAYLAYRRF